MDARDTEDIGFAGQAQPAAPAAQAAASPTAAAAQAAASHAEACGLRLVRDDEGLALAGEGMLLRADFARLLPRVREDRLQRELLVRAARVKDAQDPRAVDATAGLAEDSFLLAAAGFRVELYERDPVIAALLRDALARAEADPRLAPITGRMRLHEEDSVAALAHMEPAPDLVYLDPMFPARRKSAAVKKKLQLLQRLEAPCTDEDAEALVRAAVAAGPRKVVIKRPPKGPQLAGIKPAYSLEGKAVRFDCLVPANMPAAQDAQAGAGAAQPTD